MKQLYSHRSQLVLGFHGCDATLAEQVVLGKTMLKESDHDYDWLGHGLVLTAPKVQKLDKAKQREALGQLRELGASVRQLERLRGISRGIIQFAKL